MVALLIVSMLLSFTASLGLPHSLQLGRELGQGQAVSVNPGLGLLKVKTKTKSGQNPCTCSVSPCPCATLGETGPDPEDEDLFYGVQAMTEQDFQEASTRAFVSEVIQDEDRRIAQFAAVAAEEAAETAEREQAALDEAERRREEIQHEQGNATLAVAHRLGNATLDILTAVAERAMEVGRQEQATEDQEAIAAAWEARAEDIRRLADDASREAAVDEQRAEAMRVAAAEFGSNVSSTSAEAAAARAHANEVRAHAEELQQAAVVATEEAELAAEAHGYAIGNATENLHGVAMSRVEGALRTQDMLSAAIGAPAPFAAGVVNGLQR